MPKYVYESIPCPVCGELKKSTGLHRHVKSHGEAAWQDYLAKNQKPTRTYKQVEDGFQCLHCSFTGSSWQSVAAHAWRAHTEEGRAHIAVEVGTQYPSDRSAWNKGLSKETDQRVAKNGEAVALSQQKQLAEGSYRPRSMGADARKRLAERQSLMNTGGRCEWYWVNGVHVQGTWERDVALKLTELGIQWERPTKNSGLFAYTLDGRKRVYTPDFYLPEFDSYLEIKGYWWGDDRRKMDTVREQHPDKNIILIQKNEFEKLLNGDLSVLNRVRVPEQHQFCCACETTPELRNTCHVDQCKDRPGREGSPRIQAPIGTTPCRCS